MTDSLLKQGRFRAAIPSFLLSLAFFMILPLTVNAVDTGGVSIQSITPAQAEALKNATPAERRAIKNITPSQKRAIQTELEKTGGKITPEAVELLKKSPGFKGLKPEEVEKGRKLLERKSKVKSVKKRKGTSSQVVRPESRGSSVSLFDRYIYSKSPLEVSTRLKPFGYGIFNRPPRVSPEGMPVSSDYIIGPGDEINVLLWGRINERYAFTVTRNGTVLFPNIGPVAVAGMTFAEMKAFLGKQAKSIVGAEINVTMGKLRSIQVFVLGEVKRPGAHMLSAMSTITNAMMAAGGPNGIGTLRRVELKRGNKTIAHMDFYDLLLKGNKSKDTRLRNGDIVFVPTTGPLVGVAGNVKRPAIYELRKGTSLDSVLALAGGIIPTAYTQQIQVERVEGNKRRVAVDINASEGNASKRFLLRDADLVKVFSIVGKEANVVYLRGNVKRPGKYQLKKGMKVGDLVRSDSNLLKGTYFDYALIKRFVPPSLDVVLIPFNLGAVLFHGSDKDNIELQPQDSIYVFSKWFFKERPTVSISGEVREGGTFDLDRNLKVKDLVLMAGGLTRDASYGQFELYRSDPVTKQVTISRYNIRQALDGDPSNNIELKDQDRLVVHSVWENVPKQLVSVAGDVRKPGPYPYASNMRVNDLVFAAGNLLESAYLDDAEITTHAIVGGRDSTISYRHINLARAMADDPANNILLRPYDTLFVKRITNWMQIKRVKIEGEVRFPGTYLIKKGERLSSLIERAGGYTDKAYLRAAVFKRRSVKRLQQESLNRMIDRLERRLLVSTSRQVSTALSREAIDSKKIEADQKREFIASLRKLKATGRMTIQLALPRLMKGSDYDIELAKGDSLYIPQENSVVNVGGAVMSPGSFVYTDVSDYKNYISMAGGYADFADIKNVYVLKVDGSARRLSSGLISWNSIKSRWEVTAFGDRIREIEPGDSIVVPEKLERVAWLRNIKDITQILMQMAVTGGVLINLY